MMDEAKFDRFNFVVEDAKRDFGRWDMCDAACGPSSPCRRCSNTSRVGSNDYR